MDIFVMTVEKSFTIKQVSDMLQMSEQTVRRWIKGQRRGKPLRAIEVPGRGATGTEYRIPISALEEQGFKIEDKD